MIRLHPRLAFVVLVMMIGVALTPWSRSIHRLRDEIAGVAPPAEDFRPGDSLTSIAGVKIPTATATIVIFMNSSCQYCIDSMPFYRIISKRASRVEHPLGLMVVGIEGKPVLEQFLRRYDVTVSQVVVAKREDVRVRVTPTILLVKHSAVQRVWIGEQTESSRTLILREIDNASES
jgi:hypothetical protein